MSKTLTTYVNIHKHSYSAYSFCFQLKITATDNGKPESKSTSVNIKVFFINLNSEPIFDVHTEDIYMHEVESVGKSEALSQAHYNFATVMPNISDHFAIFYFIKNVNPTEYITKFSIDNKECTITLDSELDASKYEYVILTIAASKNVNGSNTYDEDSRLTVTVRVRKNIFLRLR